eukprot:COSAG03_NODE_495_length_7431_cov_96.088048_3_plen_155_part_00
MITHNFVSFEHLDERDKRDWCVCGYAVDGGVHQAMVWGFSIGQRQRVAIRIEDGDVFFFRAGVVPHATSEAVLADSSLSLERMTDPDGIERMTEGVTAWGAYAGRTLSQEAKDRRRAERQGRTGAGLAAVRRRHEAELRRGTDSAGHSIFQPRQ